MKASPFQSSPSTSKTLPRHQNVSSVEVSQFIAAIKKCIRSHDLTRAKKLHEQAVSLAIHTNKFVAALLTTMYSRCHCMLLARRVFNEMNCRDVVSWNSLILGYVENGDHLLALDLFMNMDCAANPGTYIAVLKGCIGLPSTSPFEKQFCLEIGIDIHKTIIDSVYNYDISIAATLVDMYSKCGSIRHAREVFEGVKYRDTVLWTTLVLAYVENGDCVMAMNLFLSMDCDPDSFMYVASLKACAGLCTKTEVDRHFCLEKGIDIHKRIQECGLDSSLFVSNALVDMYSKVGSMKHAREIFHSVRTPDVVTWTSLVLGYVTNGKCLEALELLGWMNCKPNSATFIAVCKGCAGLAAERGLGKEFCLEKGIEIHKQVRDSGLSSDVVVANALIEMYSRLGSMQHAKEAFDGTAHWNVFSWTSLMLGYVENGESSVAMELFHAMDCKPDHVTYIAVLKACSSLARKEPNSSQFCLEKGMFVHHQLKQHGLESDIVVVNTLVDMYSRCRSMSDARKVFLEATNRDVVTWTSVILGYVENGESEIALDLFSSFDLEASVVTYVAVLKACSSLPMTKYKVEFAFEKGMWIHKQIKHQGADLDNTVANSLIDMYTKLGSMNSAKAVFDRIKTPDTVSWTILLRGYVENGDCLHALGCFVCMNAEPSTVTYTTVLKACGVLGEEMEKHFFLEKGIQVHKQVKDRGFEDHLALSNTLLDTYCKCGSMPHAKELFDGIRRRDVVTWTSLMLGYLKNEKPSLALDLFSNAMDCEPDLFTYVVVLKSCGLLGATVAGLHIHAQLCKLGHTQDQVVANSLVDFYVRCGSMTRAEILFNSADTRDPISWNSLLTGHASLGNCKRVLDIVKEMPESGCESDDVTFLSVLTACSHAGLVDEGKVFFGSLLSRRSYVPMEHYNCLVDMLGRANRLEEALNFIFNMPMEANTTTWMTLLGACKKWKNLDVGKVAFHELVAAGVENPAVYLLMSNIPANVGETPG